MRYLVSAVLASALLGAVPLAAEQPPARQITVTGEGSVEARPDMATIVLGVSIQDDEAQVAMKEVSESVAQILQRLDQMGIAREDIQTRAISLYPVRSDRRGSMPSGGPDEVDSFVASNTVSVRVRELAGLGAVLDAVIADGANQLNGLSFGVQEPEPLMEEARRRAVRDATATAALLAETAGVALGPVQSITDQGSGGPELYPAAALHRASDVPVAPGEVTVRASVAMVFSIGD